MTVKEAEATISKLTAEECKTLVMVIVAKHGRVKKADAGKKYDYMGIMSDWGYNPDGIRIDARFYKGTAPTAKAPASSLSLKDIGLV